MTPEHKAAVAQLTDAPLIKSNYFNGGKCVEIHPDYRDILVSLIAELELDRERLQAPCCCGSRINRNYCTGCGHRIMK